MQEGLFEASQSAKKCFSSLIKNHTQFDSLCLAAFAGALSA